jgi:predicted RNase H-like HicB family nuclease
MASGWAKSRRAPPFIDSRRSEHGRMPPKVRELIAELEAIPDSRGANRHRGGREMRASARYAKIVEWSAEDNCYVGSAPGLILGGCHGDNEQAVFEELCQIVDEAIALYEKDGKPLPPPTSGRDFANRMQRVV